MGRAGWMESMLPSDGFEALPVVRDLLQVASSVVLVLVAFVGWRFLRAAAAGNRVQLDLDLQVFDVTGGDLVGELVIALQNMGPRVQKLENLFLEVRPSRHVSSGTGSVVPVTNVITEDDYPLLLPPGVRHLVTWTFEIPREERLLRATALINTGKRKETALIQALSPKYIWEFGPTARFVTRAFEVTAGSFRRF
jgi:hypothetical protein